MKKSKQAYYDKYFERNWNNIKNTWRGIISIISLKHVASSVATVLSLDTGDTITNPYDMTVGLVEFQMIGLNPICLIAISMYL